MLGVSFYRPVDYFSGMFNRFVAWMTSGNFCHTELVIQAKPSAIMAVIKEIYNGAAAAKYHPDDCQRIVLAIESNFFDNRRFRDLAQSSDMMWLSFSLLWGSPMFVRPLEEHHHDSWFRIPSEQTENMELHFIDNIEEEQVLETLKFSIEELGKNYDTSGALCSWLPWESAPKPQYESYFCSEFVVTVFQRLGFMNELSAAHTTPNTLYNYINTKMNNT
jgi:hypothetical protein